MRRVKKIFVLMILLMTIVVITIAAFFQFAPKELSFEVVKSMAAFVFELSRNDKDEKSDPWVSLRQDDNGLPCELEGEKVLLTPNIDNTLLKGKAIDVQGIAIASDERIYFTDFRARTINVIFPNGEMEMIMGNPGDYGCSDGKRGQAKLFQPKELIVNQEQELVFFDHFMLRKLSKDGVLKTIAGSSSSKGDKGRAIALVSFNATIAKDSQGIFYIGDLGKVKKVLSAGNIEMVVDLGKYGLPNEAIDRLQFNSGDVLFFVSDNKLFKFIRPGHLEQLFLPLCTDSNTGSDECWVRDIVIGADDTLYIVSLDRINKRQNIYGMSDQGELTLIVSFGDKDRNPMLKNGWHGAHTGALEVDQHGNLFYWSRNFGIVKLTAAGEVRLLVPAMSDEEYKQLVSLAPRQ